MNFAYLFKYIVIGDQSTPTITRRWKIMHRNAIHRSHLQTRIRRNHRSLVCIQNYTHQQRTHQTANLGHSIYRLTEAGQ
mgnify:FL=1